MYTEAEDTAQWLTAFAALPEYPIQFPAPSGSSQPPVPPAPEDPTSSSDTCEHIHIYGIQETQTYT